jgi:hypothetical protein
MSSTFSTLQSLSQSEVLARRAAGQGNDIPVQTSRTYWYIFRDNLFTFINSVYLFLSRSVERKLKTEKRGQKRVFYPQEIQK